MDNFKQLFIGKRTGMVDRKNVEVKISLSTRFKTYFFKLGHDLLPDKVFRRLFRKRWIKDVYYKNDPSK